MGRSLAYHRTLRGWTDVVPLERKQLTSGTTWHAAGLVGQLGATHNLTRLAQYTMELYGQLQRESGQNTGYRQMGSLAIATRLPRDEFLDGEGYRHWGHDITDEDTSLEAGLGFAVACSKPQEGVVNP
ncbi:FAD-binding oxidoreductase [Bradyrhizobium sp. 179]|uniref:FAD-dependent oxidoreductase n=1 Tax=Bradyrhizobium sp. 179 TaxID=2782648 RepID=UPI001FFB262F|nr:FAD-dependent oxidoreductase [Bradyrhizobium sp. 179]MCK1544431.1 FAD-binding oxidoreductase [Bradyrhizobium sp. 179]